MKNIAIFASGSGTNAENIINHFLDSKTAKIRLVLCNKRDAFVLKRAEKYGVPTLVFSKEELVCSSKVLDYLKDYEIDVVILAGFLLLMPPEIVDQYRGRILNIHPALLPNYGGKGMYGDRVHKAVIEASEQVSGITIHQVNEQFDRGDILFQAQTPIDSKDTPETLAQKIHLLEQTYFPAVIDDFIKTIN